MYYDTEALVWPDQGIGKPGLTIFAALVEHEAEEAEKLEEFAAFFPECSGKC